MTTNREWLYSLDVADLADWFDAEHVDATCDNTGENVTHDTREKLEGDVAKWSVSRAYGSEGYDFIIGALDRQAAITRREVLTQPDERDEQLAELTAQLYELTEERDALADDLFTCNKEREEYRDLFSEALTLAAEIVNLQP